jgi:hypothetical protein
MIYCRVDPVCSEQIVKKAEKSWERVGGTCMWRHTPARRASTTVQHSSQQFLLLVIVMQPSRERVSVATTVAYLVYSL